METSVIPGRQATLSRRDIITGRLEVGGRQTFQTFRRDTAEAPHLFSRLCVNAKRAYCHVNGRPELKWSSRAKLPMGITNPLLRACSALVTIEWQSQWRGSPPSS